MASENNSNIGNNANNSSLIPPSSVLVVTPERYLENQRKLQQHFEMLNEANRTGLENYLRMEADLQRRMDEGDRARQQMQTLQQLANARTIAPPPRSAAIRAGPSQNANASSHHSQYQQPHSNLVNGSEERYTANPSSSGITPALQQPRSSHVPSPISYPPTSPGHAMSQTTQSVPIRLPPQIPIASSNVNALPQQQPVQQPPRHKGSSRPTSYLQPQPQQVKFPTGTAPSGSHVQGPQSQPWYFHPAVASSPSSISGYRGSLVAGPNQQSYYAPSSSSLAGALGETSTTHGKVANSSVVYGHPPLASMDSAERRERTVTTEQALARDQVPTKSISVPVTYALPTHNTTQADVMSRMAGLTTAPDDPLRLAQARVASMLRRQADSESVSSGSYYDAQGSVPAIKPPNLGRTETMTAAANSSQITSGIHDSVPVAQIFTPASSTGGPGFISNVPRASGANILGSAQNLAPAPGVSSRYTQPAPTERQNVGVATTSDTPISRISNVTGAGASSHALLNNSAPYYPVEDNRFTTPPGDENRPLQPVTPASANKNTLAKDILRALNRLPEKRKASTPEYSASDVDAGPPPPKRPIIENSPTDTPMVISDIFMVSSAHPVMEDTGDSARIEEVVETGKSGMADESAAVLDTSSPLLSISAIDNSEVVPLWVTTSDAPTVPDSLPPPSSAESRVSSEAAVEADTELQPFDDSSVPLFLPSPRNSPTPSYSEPRDERDGIASSSSLQRSAQVDKSKFKTRVYVEVPILTPEQRRRFLSRGNAQLSMEVPASEGVSVQGSSIAAANAATDAKVVNSGADEQLLREAQEVAALSASRLQKRPCLWNDCYHVANSANALKAHVREHVELISEKEKIFPCWWGDCIRRFNKREALAHHLQNHVKKSIYCAYQGCDAHFSHPLEFLSHVQNKHPSGGHLRPSVKPFVPPFFPLPPLGMMSAYLVINLPVQPAPVSKERRAKLGPWVAKNCFGSVNLGVPSFNARNQPQRRRLDDSGPKLIGDWQDRYDFVEPTSTRNPPALPDLESSKATEEIENGLVLLPDRAGPRGPLKEHVFTSRADRIGPQGKGKYVIKAENEEGDVAEMPGIQFVDMSAVFSQEQSQSHSHQIKPQSFVYDSQGLQSGTVPAVYKDFLGVGEPQPQTGPQPQSQSGPQPQSQPQISPVDISCLEYD